MKKILFILCLFFSANTVLAVDLSGLAQTAAGIGIEKITSAGGTNLRQIKAEKEFKKEVYNADKRVNLHYYLIHRDYEVYKENGEAILNVIENFEKSTNVLYAQYAAKAKNLYLDIAQCEDENIPAASVFDKKKIIIPDTDFDKLNEDLKKIIFMLNIY